MRIVVLKKKRACRWQKLKCGYMLLFLVCVLTKFYSCSHMTVIGDVCVLPKFYSCSHVTAIGDVCYF